MHRLIVVSTLVLLFTGCGDNTGGKPKSPAPAGRVVHESGIVAVPVDTEDSTVDQEQIDANVAMVPSAELEAAESYELLSLDPEQLSNEEPQASPNPDSFHQYLILGRTKVTDPAVRKRLNDALVAGARENASMASGCFEPRHGIRVTRGDEVTDLVICFKCLQVYVFHGLENSDKEYSDVQFLIAESPKSVFDKALRAANVKLPGSAN